jgi:hypothetical protein
MDRAKSYLDAKNGLLTVLGDHYEVDQILDTLGLDNSRREYRSKNLDEGLMVYGDSYEGIPVDVCVQDIQKGAHPESVMIVISPTSEGEAGRVALGMMHQSLEERAKVPLVVPIRAPAVRYHTPLFQ